MCKNIHFWQVLNIKSDPAVELWKATQISNFNHIMIPGD